MTKEETLERFKEEFDRVTTTENSDLIHIGGATKELYLDAITSSLDALLNNLPEFDFVKERNEDLDYEDAATEMIEGIKNHLLSVN